jgi:hypothetical protein
MFTISQEKIDSLPRSITFFGLIYNSSTLYAILGYTYSSYNWSVYLIMSFGFTLHFVTKQNGTWQTPRQII